MGVLYMLANDYTEQILGLAKAANGGAGNSIPYGLCISPSGLRAQSARPSDTPMKRGFYIIMAAQFFSSLADNMLWVVVIAALRSLSEPQWMEPLPQVFFVISYVIFAWYVGAFAD